MNKFKNIRIAIVGAGIYGSTVASHLKELGCKIDIYDDKGIMGQTSSINQFRIHSGYHYPRSIETIKQVQKSKESFIKYYQDCIFSASEHYYAIAKEDSKTSSSKYEKILKKHSLPFKKITPNLFDYQSIDSVYLVDEKLYDPNAIKIKIMKDFQNKNINFYKKRFTKLLHDSYDFIIYADYGVSFPRGILDFKLSLVEKCYFQPPKNLQNKSIVIIDGPFTAFDTTIDPSISIFGSAKYTNLLSFNIEQYKFVTNYFKGILNKNKYIKTEFTNYKKFLEDCVKYIPAVQKSKYLGSRYTIRIIEDNPKYDNRTFYIKKDKKIFYIFSGKVVSCIDASKKIIKEINNAIS
jgi:hypothetical protein